MKTILLAICGLLFFGVDATPYLTSDSAISLDPACAKGQVYWCQNLATAKSCHAVTHCIQSVWEKQTYPVDTDSICQICLDMVKQARDQLRSNETQEELKEVFEGTCEFIRIKSIRKECDKLADDMVPELVEALSSQMNPQVVCSVSGLCNNAKIDKELRKHANEQAVVKKKTPTGLTCNQCNTISTLISTKFANTNRDQVLENMLTICGGMSSLSDGCAAIVLSYFNEVYDHMKDNLNAENICHMAGVCSDQFHQHEEDHIDITPDSQIGFVQHEGDDIPCDLCKQLIVHLRDLLVANTTETEFKNILEGVCKQTKSFKSECLSLADQYYDIIYAKLTQNLDPDGACFMIGICPKNGLSGRLEHSYEMMPLVPSSQLLVKKKLILGDNEPVLSAQEIQSFQLPKDVTLLNPDQIVANGVRNQRDPAFCTLCEYFLHFVQDALASPVNEENIKRSVLNMCNKVGKSLQDECQQFVETYSDAVIALLIQEIDPSEICPRLSVCVKATPTANEKCPLCLFLVQDLEDQLQHNRSKKNIEEKLHVLCTHLRDDLKAECIDFINTYTAELVDKLANDFSPREICLYLKCCTDKEETLIENIGDRASYNDYLTNTVYEVESEQSSSPECILCEQLVRDVEKKITKDESKDHIKKVLEDACSSLPKQKLKNKCKAAVEKNADYIVDLLVKEVTPKEVCLALGFCFTQNNDIVQVVTLPEVKPKPSDYTCRFCKIVVKQVEEQLNNKTNQEDVEKCLEEVCVTLPKSLQPKCKKFIDAYANELIKYIPNESPEAVCKKSCLCDTSDEEVSAESVEIEVQRPKPSEYTCRYCKIFVKEVEEQLNNKTNQENVEKCMEEVCVALPKSLQPKCKKFIDAYANELIKYIPNESPEAVCKKSCLCDASDEEVSAESVEIEVQRPKPSEYTCRYCKIVVQEVEEQLNNKTNQEDVEKCMEEVCVTLPKKMQPKCKKFIDAYANELIKHIPNESPEAVCKKSCLCDASDEEVSAESVEIAEDISSPECLLCEQIIKDVEHKVANDKSKDHIKEVLEQACSTINREDLKEKCIEVIDKNTDYIVDAIVKDLSPKQICHGIGFCASPKTSVDLKIEHVADQLMELHSNTPQCVLCELIATKLETELKDKKSQDEIENVVRRVCHSMPSKLSVKCDKFIEDYGDLFISIVSTVPPKQLCGELNFCRSKAKVDTSRNDVLECAVCNTAVDALATVLDKNGPKAEEIVVETACHLMPAQYYQQCHDFLKIYGVSLTTLINRSEKRSDICVKVGKCFQDGDNSMFVEISDGASSSESEESSESVEVTESHKRLLGADNNCTFGPSYWCSSPENMKECHAEEYCKTRFNKQNP